MRRWPIIWFFLSSALVLTLRVGASPSKPDVAGDGTVIRNVTVISSERSTPLAHATVVIRDGRIAHVVAES